METREPIYFDPHADGRALANGVSAAEIEAKNAFLTPDRTIIHWDPNREF